MANISLTLYTNSFFGSILMSPIQMGSLSVNNLVTNISRWGTFKVFLAISLNFTDCSNSTAEKCLPKLNIVYF